MDPTQVRNQPALTTSSGTIWLVVGGLFTAIALGVLVPMTALPPGGVALGAAVADVVLYAVIVAARWLAPAGPIRLRLMAVAMLAIAAVSLGATLVVAFTAIG